MSHPSNPPASAPPSGGKPPIHSREQWEGYAARYRRMLIAADPALESRLCAGSGQRVAGFLNRAMDWDVILLDAYGVLNRGAAAIAGAAEAVAALMAAGRSVWVLSNNTSQAPEQVVAGFMRMGFALEPGQVLTSGMAVTPFINGSSWAGLPYYLIGTPESRDHFAPQPHRYMVNHPHNPLPLEAAEYILICSDRDYYAGEQPAEVAQLLERRALPILLGNPDLVAPDEHNRPHAVSGFTAAQLVERHGCPLVGIGKPFAPVYDLALQRLGARDGRRVLMVGDTLETDVLGGIAAGWHTCLTLSGNHAAQAEGIARVCAARGIIPDFVVDSIAH
ncbi:MAG: TIGR01459 family HAD-type hydrolase [Magnetococcus sp. WYHC-3]